MSPHYLGKNVNAPIDRRSLGVDMDDIDELYGRGLGDEQPARRRISPGEITPIDAPIGAPGYGRFGRKDTTPAGYGRFGEKEFIRLNGEAAGEEAQPESYVDDLMASLFGKGFETIRGIGGRSQEAVYDMLARQGLLGTGAATDVGREMAWQTERGITDLIRSMGEMRAGKEQEAMNMLMTWLGMTSQSWG